MKAKKFMSGLMAVACCTIVNVSCTKGPETLGNLQDYQNQTYSESFAEAIATPASNQDWGFGSFSITPVTEPVSSFDYYGEDEASARTRAVAETVTSVKEVKYYHRDNLMAADSATCYFFLRIDNQIVQKETTGTQLLSDKDYYPLKEQNLGNGVKDKQFNTDNVGLLNIAKWKALGLTENGSGISYATDDEPIPADVFYKAPTFEQMALHIPDARKEQVAGSVEAFNSNNYKICWYVAKWQKNSSIHVDGIVVPKDQVTINVPEYKKRIIVEDLKGNITPGTQVSGSDFDFNDVVFDAVTWQRNKQNHLKIIVRAAGGQKPIYVAGKEIHEDIGYMFNTSNPNYDFAKVLVKDSIISSGASTFDFNSIPVQVDIDGQMVTAEANIGQAPEKVAVDVDFKWCSERQNIKTVYPRFADYVGNKEITNWWK